jgi:hypothetical protein
MVAVVMYEICNSCRRTRITEFSCCCGMLRIKRDPLQGDEIIDDAKADEIYPDKTEDLKSKLSHGFTLSSEEDVEKNVTDNRV